MKIKSFTGRRLLLGLTVEQLADKLEWAGEVVKKIERIELSIQRLNTVLDELEEENKTDLS